MLYLLNEVLHDLERDIASQAPERGGALLGPVGIPVISRFVFDPTARTTRVTYSPSRELATQVQEIERQENLEFKGIVHSHPSGMDHPSGQDERELRVGLELNPQMPYYLAPIVTVVPPCEIAEHETELGAGKISFFAAHRAQEGIDLQEIPVEVVTATELIERLPHMGDIQIERNYKMRQDIEAVRNLLGGGEPEVFTTVLEGATLAAGSLVLDDGMELLFLCGTGYPASPPLLLVTSPGGNTQQILLSWNLQTPAEQRLIEAVAEVFTQTGPYERLFGTANGLALTSQPEQAYLAGWQPRYIGQDARDASVAAHHQQFARVEGVLSPEIRDTTVLIAGLGSVGSYFAEQLARCGVGGFILIDPETVEPANLSRSVYELGDVGQPKTAALARRLWNINPELRLELRSQDLLDNDVQELERLVARADLVVGGTDDLAAQRALNRFAYAQGAPALFIGLYAGAHGGEVILSLPEQTPCYQCATSTRHEMEQETSRVGRSIDYGTGRLAGEIALGADIQHVTSAAVKMALALLTPAHAEARLKNFLTQAIADQMTYLTLSTVPEYWFYPQIFGETGGQYAYQSLWLTPTRRPECPVCGERETRVQPCDIPLRAPRLGDLRNIATQAGTVVEGEIVEA